MNSRSPSDAQPHEVQSEALSQDHQPDSEAVGAGLDLADPNSRLAPLYLCPRHVAALVFLAVVFVFLSHLRVWHTDVWGHLRFGEYIVTRRQLPRHEMFSGPFADQAAPYINYQWLAQAGAYLAFDFGRQLSAPDFEHRLGGGALLLSAVHASLVTLRLLVLLLAFRRLTASLPFALVGVGLVFGMGLLCHLCILRPQIIGELGFAALVFALSSPVLSRRAVIGIPLVLVLWANCHGSFPVGLTLLGIALAGQAVQTLITAWHLPETGPDSSRPERFLRRARLALFRDRQIRRLALALLLGVGAIALLNPHGPALYLHSWQLSQNPNIHFMEEWKPLPLQSLAGGDFWASVLLLLALVWWSPRRFSPTQVLLLLVFGLQTLAHARVLVWWIMVFAWVAVPHMQAVYERYFAASARRAGRPSLRNTIVAGLMCGVLLQWSAPAQWALWAEAPVGSKRVTALTPLKVADYLAKRYAEDPALGRCVFTSETQGEYLLWALRLTPPVRIFCYTHVHLFTPQHWQECMIVKNGDRGWQAVLDRHAVQFVVVEADQHRNLVAQVRAAPERWQIISNGAIFVAERRS